MYVLHRYLIYRDATNHYCNLTVDMRISWTAWLHWASVDLDVESDTVTGRPRDAFLFFSKLALVKCKPVDQRSIRTFQFLSSTGAECFLPSLATSIYLGQEHWYTSTCSTQKYKPRSRSFQLYVGQYCKYFCPSGVSYGQYTNQYLSDQSLNLNKERTHWLPPISCTSRVLRTSSWALATRRRF